MSLVTRSLGAAALFLGVLLFAWLAPAPSEEFEVGSNTAYAGGKTGKSKGSKNKSSAGGANKRYHVHVKAAIKHLKAVRKNLASAPVQYGGHREKALNNISSALRELEALERHLRKHGHAKKS